MLNYSVKMFNMGNVCNEMFLHLQYIHTKSSVVFAKIRFPKLESMHIKSASVFNE